MMEEAKENDHGVTSPSLPSLALPRSPLISIPNPSQTPKSAQTTPKSAHSRASCYRRLSELPPLTESRGGTREKGCARRILDSCNLSKSLSSGEELVQVPCFELNEDPSFWKDRNVQVLIRIRPIGASESTIHGHKRCISQESSQSLTWIGNPETRFTFDHVASESISQEKLFRAVGVPMVENCMSGYNGCMFAYGQTGSGKTYTMMGELREVENYPSEDRGMTPRIFEYLFSRIKEEEERRNEEKLKYNCRCSFLEIYNEQITDLLEPSSSNLQLREDMEKGVYVEGLKECEASSVRDIMALLLQGVANRRMAATKMNSESSRSHSVFTCIIESQWEKDSLSHLRFSRLNLVDLAGSERQKSSGAEGERLKEAANINRSLSTLGLVIMSLVDIANGKSRHVPYRDSRLTFLLQDSLGGNSKTIVLSTVSPSICSSSETLSTLKFAQRAKLIQNNAKVNEDSSGDVIALQRQIQILKDQLRSSKTHHEISTNSINPSLSFKRDNLGSTSDEFGDSSNNLIHLNQKVIDLEAALSSSMRRERMCEMEIKRLEGEIKHMGRLVHLIEDDAHRTKEKQKISEEKIRRMELLADDLIYSEGYLMEDNVSLKKELELVRNQVDKNPQVEKFALENMRLIEQIKSFENYHQFGEREILLTEISQLRNQLHHIFEGNYLPNNTTNTETIEPKSSETITISDQEIRRNNLEDQIKSLTEENQKLLEAITSRDLEWETAIFDLTKFLSEGYDSLEEASQSIENVMSLFPKRGVEDFSMVNGFVERAIRANLERENLVNELRAKLDDARRIERDLKGKLNCLRGATLAFTELHERESDERFKEILDLKKSSSNEEILVPTGSNSKVCLEEVNQKIEKHEKDTKNLLFQFEKAQETMQEAELMLSTLLHSTETARGERDSLIKSHCFSLEETNQLVSSIEDTFHQIKCEVAKEMDGIQSETASFVHEVKDWIEKLRVFCANLPLTREFERKNEIVEGLFFDLRLLQESTSYRSDVNEKYKQIGASLKNLQEELNAKTSLVEKMAERQEFLETELSISRSELERMQQLCSVYEKENNEFEIILKEEELKNSEIEASLQDKCVLIEGLEREILSKNGNSVTKCMLSSRNLEREIERVSQERDKFEREVISLKTKLEMAMALAEEREAISVEAQQVAEMSKMYVEEKEEEVKVLEHSIEELEATIDVLEGKVRDLKEEIESYQYVTRNKELYEAQKYIEDLETELEYRDEEIKQYKDHISELVLHSEAQSSLFTEKFKALEEMALSTRARKEASGSNNESNNGEITEKPLARTRGSGSPFKCMSSLVHQIGMEKDKELSKSRQRIQELEALLSTKQQEICILSARLAAVDTMTHDVIRDLLGVKLDMNNYANMLDQEQLENLLVKSHQQAEESKAKDEEILNLRNKIDELYDEKESLIEDINQIKAEILESQMIVEGLEQRENLLTTKNKILKMDKVNLHKKILERDEIIESMASSNGNKKEEGSSRNGGIEEFRKRLEQSDKLLSHARQEKYISRKS